MALYPCDADGRFYRGRQCAAYVRVGNGNDFDRWKLRLCSAHISAAQDDLTEFEVDTLDDAAGWAGPGIQCIACLQPVHEGGRVWYITVYPADNERKDYYGLLHAQCDLPSTLVTRQLGLLDVPPVVPPQNVSNGARKRGR